jgi:hypothetical protein
MSGGLSKATSDYDWKTKDRCMYVGAVRWLTVPSLTSDAREDPPGLSSLSLPLSNSLSRLDIAGLPTDPGPPDPSKGFRKSRCDELGLEGPASLTITAVYGVKACLGAGSS